MLRRDLTGMQYIKMTHGCRSTCSCMRCRHVIKYDYRTLLHVQPVVARQLYYGTRSEEIYNMQANTAVVVSRCYQSKSKHFRVYRDLQQQHHAGVHWQKPSMLTAPTCLLVALPVLRGTIATGKGLILASLAPAMRAPHLQPFLSLSDG